MTTLYGIPNCDTVKKARTWLGDRHIAYTFVDFKKNPPDAALIERWLGDIPLSTLLNKRGTTWRGLTAEAQAQADTVEGAVALMAAYPSLIKRPVLEHRSRCSAGFQADDYAARFAGELSQSSEQSE